MVIFGLITILLIVLILPIAVKKVEHNLEIFLFIMGFIAVLVSGTLSKELFLHIFESPFIYMITGAVLVISIVFKLTKSKLTKAVDVSLNYVPLKLFVFLMIVVLGLLSSVITAIIAALILVEVIHELDIARGNKVKINIIACFSIGLGAALTPIGEPLSTIVVSKLNVGFGYLFNQIGLLVVPGILILGYLGSHFAHKPDKGEDTIEKVLSGASTIMDKGIEEADNAIHKVIGEDDHIQENKIEAMDDHSVDTAVTNGESYKDIFLRAAKIFAFIIGLELLGAGYRPFVDAYILNLDTRILYWVNLTSAVLDNATLAAAEISPQMNPQQVKQLLMGLLISGGMMIPGNIPNIITAGKLGIKSREWVIFGVPLGLIMLIIYYIVLFAF
ncbi:MAG: DUF1646 domain-containing protein [Clostridia bacterium]|nr:DUF1646 domain-containing protein [Clostridia bacterium]